MTLALLGIAAPVAAKGFNIDRLPHGKDVTIPRPATTYVGAGTRVKFTATDVPQTISLRAIHTAGGKPTTMKVAIFDPLSERVRYVNLTPGTPYVYAFEDLGSITIMPSLPAGDGSSPKFKNFRVQVESDKPLSIAH
jgi:plastocyanin